MIKITIYKDQEGIYKSFDCKGHANFADAGQDIVCAAVSILVINTVNSIENLAKCKSEATSNEETGEIHFRFLEEVNPESKLLMDSLVLGLEGIQENYGNKYLFLNFKEV